MLPPMDGLADDSEAQWSGDGKIEYVESDIHDPEWLAPSERRKSTSRSTGTSRRNAGSIVPPTPSEESVLDDTGKVVGSLLPSSSESAPLSTSIAVEIPVSTLIVPRSRHEGFEPPAPELSEGKAVEALLQSCAPNDDDDSFEFELDMFSIFINTDKYSYEMRPLQHLSTKDVHNVMYADGVLSHKDTKFYVRGIAFDELPIGNYGMDHHTLGDQIWIRSRVCTAEARGRGPDIYYKLKSPTTEYLRYHSPFLWIADLAKHVVDFLEDSSNKNRRVEFRDFKSAFHKWLLRHHKGRAAFRRWFGQYGRTDFRVAVHAYNNFIYKEAFGVLGHKRTHFHTLWREIKDYTAYTPAPSTAAPMTVDNKDDTKGIPRTVVTPYVYDSFSHLPCGVMMESVTPSASTERLRTNLIQKQHLELPSHIHNEAKHIKSVSDARAEGLKREVRVGDVVSCPRDAEDTNWRRHTAVGFDDVDRWFGLVQKVHVSKSGARSLDVIWMYRPVDTLCGQMRYPWNNELFLSDHCSCDDGHDYQKLGESEVLAIHRIDWGGSSATNAEFFCRQTYISSDRRWITFRQDHLVCSHRKEPTPNPDHYRAGDTVLVQLTAGGNRLEPCELLEPPRDSACLVRVRLLLRRNEVDPKATACRPNELVYSERILEVRPDRIHGRCIVRYFPSADMIKTPYDRDGVGNAFYILTRLVEEADGDDSMSTSCVPFDDAFPFPPTFRQGLDPDEAFPKLKGFDLFCGGGNFGRGLEESGVIEMKWANDISIRAIHTYMANVDARNQVHPFAGSIDDLQRRALQGKFSDNVPPIGEVGFVSGGSPCPGFSRLTHDKTTPEQRKNQSLVASFASFIDIYRPRFGLLENVVEIIESAKASQQDVFLQLICAIVGLGYQTQFFMLDAWTFGSCQSRSRVFLAFAAPGHRLPEMPLQSHQSENPKNKSLGRLSNNEPMFQRLIMPTAFGPVSAAQAFADLPDIMDGKPDACIKFPDHRQSYGVTTKVRTRLCALPTRPWGVNLRSAYNSGSVTKAEMDRFPSSKTVGISNAYGRVFPNKLVGTVTTRPSPADRFTGRILHWHQARILSVMEVRRAQGFRDHEVILGEPKDQYYTVGNSVSREVSVALGLSFREAWLGSLVKGDENTPKLGYGVQYTTTQATSTMQTSSTVRTSVMQSSVMQVSTSTTKVGADDDGGEEEPEPEPAPEDEPLPYDWRGRRVPNEDYVPSDEDTEDVLSCSASDVHDMPTPQDSTSTPSVAEPYETAFRMTSSTVSSKKRQLSSSIIVELFAAKLSKSDREAASRRQKRMRLDGQP
ncbi:hypothetical protein SODALDRAFT_328178 [Sodiomyces alkalinus F11]|uniref:DNA (cytosine-5-)-methyltransferase n=1 Tax=Sodiomyces alkalinus (strain CBS 110278 / VKM F-3762 / F11) TaxID=1314773 RepID=A0A3N2PMY2_SODAK|nr:hypothetical protein SODALDRAFT_328178 [Sodiomyces alkalinus F11]ROT35790.1 hypothetical protein SODALDRAFT_328178 [Sodiomyces alkalinus F11]